MNFEHFFGGSPFGGSPFGGSFGRREPSGPKTFKLYELLGVDKDTDAKAIKKKYRLMSMKGPYRHPDRGGDREKFQELQEAWGWLGDEKKRKVYDKYGDACRESDFQGEPEVEIPKNRPTHHQLAVSLEELFKGTSKTLRVRRTVFINNKTNEPCETDGTELWESCSECGGQGARMQHIRRGSYILQQQVPCDSCQGQGHMLNGDWRLGKKAEDLVCHIEKGSKAGDKIKFRNKGNMMVGARPGDIVVTLTQKPHPIFQRGGCDLLMKKTISLGDALCGFRFTVPHLNGRTLTLVNKPGQVVCDGEFKKVAGEGFPVKGDAFETGSLFIHFSVRFPASGELSDADKKILRGVLGNHREPAPAGTIANGGNGEIKSRNLSPEEKAAEAKAKATLKQYRSDLEAWKEKKLQQFDTDSAFREKRLKKYPGGRSEYVRFLDQNVSDKMASETANLQSTLPAGVDLSRMNTMELEAANAEVDADTHYLDEVSKEEFGTKADAFRDNSATQEDDDDDERHGARAQTCHMQ